MQDRFSIPELLSLPSLIRSHIKGPHWANPTFGTTVSHDRVRNLKVGKTFYNTKKLVAKERALESLRSLVSMQPLSAYKILIMPKSSLL